LQVTVSYQRVTSVDGYGEPPSTPAVKTLHGIVDFKSVPTRNKEGITVHSMATITLLDVAEVVAATGGEGVQVDDLFTLADGTRGQVINIGGFMDAGTTKPIPMTVVLG
jgi:hypothetical protein